MSDLPFRKPLNDAGPSRFTGKTFSRSKTFSNSVDDYSIRIDGLTAGRIMKKKLGFQRVVWFWTLTGPYFPGPKSHDGEEDTLEKAREAFKICFWQWLAWALKQQGLATWYGADG
jgi:hypothetical protein